MPHSPIAMASAVRPEAACAAVAPTAVSPWRTTAKEDAKPTKAASSPAKSACAEKEESMAPLEPPRAPDGYTDREQCLTYILSVRSIRRR